MGEGEVLEFRELSVGEKYYWTEEVLIRFRYVVSQAGQNQFVVAPDELVGPALELTAALVDIKKRKLHPGIFLGARLVNLFDDLKG